MDPNAPIPNAVDLINAFEAVEDYRVVEEFPLLPPTADHPGNQTEDPAVNEPLGLDAPDDMNASVQGNVSQVSSSPTVVELEPQSPPHDSSPSSGASSTNVRALPSPNNFFRASDLLLAVSVGTEANRAKITEQAVSAMAELTKIALAEGEPLWQRKGDMEIMNGLQYLRDFGGMESELFDEVMKMVEVGEQSEHFELPPVNSEFKFDPLHVESSRAIGFVNMDPKSIAELLMNLNQWARVFSGFVSKAAVLGVISAEGDMNLDGMIQLMTAEFHLHTPLVPPRHTYFARYCKQLECGTWAVVDVSVDNIFPYPQIKYGKRPSGCLIQQAPNGSKVIWVEHVESENKYVHQIFQPIVNSGFAFGANRWIAAVMQDCQWQLTKMSPTTPTANPTANGVFISENGKRSLLKLSERMTIKYFKDLNASSEKYWQKIYVNGGTEDIRIRIGGSLSFPGRPTCTTLVFTSSIWLPAPPKKVFNFLRDENSRNKWDLLSYGHSVREHTYVINGQNPENRVSVLQVIDDEHKIEILYLQESFWDAAGCSYVIYAPVDAVAMLMILNGGNPDQLSILVSGFAIIPASVDLGESGGTILSVGFHIVDGNSAENYVPVESAATIDTVISSAVAWIRDAVAP